MDLVDYFSRSEWVDDPEAVRCSKCVVIDSINLDTSTNVTQQLVDKLDNENIEFNESLYSIRSVINEFLVYKEKNKILSKRHGVITEGEK